MTSAVDSQPGSHNPVASFAVFTMHFQTAAPVNARRLPGKFVESALLSAQLPRTTRRYKNCSSIAHQHVHRSRYIGSKLSLVLSFRPGVCVFILTNIKPSLVTGNRSTCSSRHRPSPTFFTVLPLPSPPRQPSVSLATVEVPRPTMLRMEVR